ncbi:hypothetical protein L1K18_24340 [Escherichia coli]|uniref:hypothetical protein n=1 Tax=Escherichia coli TaxID=562 RepID=UPI001F2B7EFD|nr:hypothetical protein [Escherichia coli]MCF2001679.1 hypothetical protein [Escherichia coli]
MRNLLSPFSILSVLLKIKELVRKVEIIQLTESQIKKTDKKVMITIFGFASEFLEQYIPSRSLRLL